MIYPPDFGMALAPCTLSIRLLKDISLISLALSHRKSWTKAQRPSLKRAIGAGHFSRPLA